MVEEEKSSSHHCEANLRGGGGGHPLRLVFLSFLHTKFSSKFHLCVSIVCLVYGKWDAWHILPVSDISSLSVSLFVTGKKTGGYCLMPVFVLHTHLLGSCSVWCVMTSTIFFPFLVRPIIIRRVHTLHTHTHTIYRFTTRCTVQICFKWFPSVSPSPSPSSLAFWCCSLQGKDRKASYLSLLLCWWTILLELFLGEFLGWGWWRGRGWKGRESRQLQNKFGRMKRDQREEQEGRMAELFVMRNDDDSCWDDDVRGEGGKSVCDKHRRQQKFAIFCCVRNGEIRCFCTFIHSNYLPILQI